MEFVKALVRKTNFTGQISFDGVRDSEGRFHVLECNPRATSGLHLSALDEAAIEKGCSLREAATQDIEWDGQALRDLAA